MSQPQDPHAATLRNLHIRPMQRLKRSKWHLIPNTCCGFVVFLAGLSFSSRTTSWSDPCGIMPAGIGFESFGVPPALQLGAAEERI